MFNLGTPIMISIRHKVMSGIRMRPTLSTSKSLTPVNQASSSKTTRYYHASAVLSDPVQYSNRRSSIARNSATYKTKTQQSDMMKIVQNQHEMSQTQTKILEMQQINHQTTLEIMKIQHNNYHTMMEITEKMEQIIHNIILTKEDVQVSDKIAFATGFGCGLVVCLAIWISPFGGKDKDEDAEK